MIRVFFLDIGQSPDGSAVAPDIVNEHPLTSKRRPDFPPFSPVAAALGQPLRRYPWKL